jgi:hypothetical protein
MNSQKDEKIPEPDMLLHEIMQKLTAPYQPASKHNFTSTFSTAEFCHSIMEHCGVEVKPMEVYHWLDQEGFHSEDIGGLSLVWLFRKRD